MPRKIYQTSYIQKINKARLEQEQEKLLALRKKNDSFLPDRLADGTCRLCGDRELTEKEKVELVEEVERLLFGPETEDEKETLNKEL